MLARRTMNRAQQKLTRRLQVILVPPVLVGTALLVAVSTIRIRAALRAHASAEAQSILSSILREQTALAALEGLALAAFLLVAVGWVARQLGQELGAVVDAADRIGERRLETRVDARSQLGIERVPLAFNGMAAKLEEAQRTIDAAAIQAQEFNQRIAHVQSLSAVGQVAASIAHEVGSPLNAILLSARMAAEDEACPDELRGTLTRIADQSERIGSILRRMLQLSQPPDELRGSCDVGAAAREILAFLSPELRSARVSSRLELPTERLTAAIQSDRLQQVLFNLVINAAQEQPDGGTVVISARREDERARIEVRDAGPGVREEARDRLWEPFYTDKRNRGGTGLGLPVVKNLVERAGGAVSIERAPEGGACFVVTLPVE
jgi:signal transduction histidine kinase